MLFVIGEQHSVVNQFLLELRDQTIQSDRLRFRTNLERLGEIMAYEISKKLEYFPLTIQTPLDQAIVEVPLVNPVLIPIMRAGLPYFNGFQRIFDRSDCGFIGAYRKEGESSVKIQLDYLATPDLTGREVILIDPMLATGRSVTDSLKNLSTRGVPKHVFVASLVSTHEAIAHLEKEINVPFSIWTFVIDPKLNQQFYIVPGLGDAGDLSFGEKM